MYGRNRKLSWRSQWEVSYEAFRSHIEVRTYTSIIVVTGILFLFSLLSGLLLSRNLRRNDPRPSGKPVAGGIFTAHKFASFAAVICAVVIIHELHKDVDFSGIQLITVICTGLLFLVVFVSAAFLSLGKPASKGMQAAHKVVSFLTVISTFGAIYVLTVGRW